MATHHLILLTLAVAVTARTANRAEEPRSSEDSFLGDLKTAYDTYKDCTGAELSNCLKRKLAKALSKVANTEELSIPGGVTITKDKDAKVNEVEVEEAVPRGLDESSLDNIIMDKIFRFMQTHTVQVNLFYYYLYYFFFIT